MVQSFNRFHIVGSLHHVTFICQRATAKNTSAASTPLAPCLYMHLYNVPLHPGCHHYKPYLQRLFLQITKFRNKTKSKLAVVSTFQIIVYEILVQLVLYFLEQILSLVYSHRVNLYLSSKYRFY